MLLLLSLIACRPPAHLSEASLPLGQVHYQERVIDLKPFLEGFPYSNFVPIWSSDRLLFDHTERAREWKATSLTAPDLASGEPVSSLDWNARTRWDMRATGDSVYFIGDERNDERLNLYRLSLNTHAIKQLTDEPYLYGYNESVDHQQIAVIARRGERPYTSCLLRIDPKTGVKIQEQCDTPEASFAWSDPSWSPDSSGVLVRANLNGERDASNLAWLKFDSDEVRLLLDPSPVRTRAAALQPWLNPTHFLYLADDSGFTQVGDYDLHTGVTRWLTQFDRELTDARLLPIGDQPQLLVSLHRPDHDTLQLINPKSAELRWSLDVDGSLSIISDDGKNTLMVSVDSAAKPKSVYRVQLNADAAPTLQPWFGPSEAEVQAISQCDVQAITVPSFDRDLHAFLYTPKVPTTTPTARILSFYGGDNVFSADTQIFCAAGISTLSPSVRGSAGFGTDFYTLNDGDLGGDEIIDLFYAARELERRGYTSDHIGVYGRSHGGYATMRALSFPPQTNGRDEHYPFAFGMADAGFSDIADFYANCNIPDWVLLEAGDPATEAEKLADRSPVHHADLLSGPLLLTHGENDSRVPVEGSKAMAAACEAAGKDCTVLLFPGQGHHVRGLANEQLLYQGRLSFLEAIFPPTKTRRSDK